MSWWGLFLLPAALPPNPPALIASADPAPASVVDPCPSPPQYSYSDWKLTQDERWFEGEWVMQRLHYRR